MNTQCDLCASETDLAVYEVTPASNLGERNITLCSHCLSQVDQGEITDANHWRCLNDSMWSQVPAVQVMAWRQLKRLTNETDWARDMLDMLYLEDDVLEWAKAGMPDENVKPTLDSNGAVLQAGDTVTLTKDLEVKGANFTAKRGTAVRGISLTDNPEHIEGRVNGTRIVILTCFCKKSN
ncbi:PhnA domain-containing protein [Motilimonas cestriensis]|uniref:PhnA domain-containing protein n=1 Tax=Motilimonas cestriensis TaxID=2742685 RepID=A0ABS8WG07_9GAMM|nr:alkylphosphonate utilization protein [Motilimonas cestriensis]MCE2597248.1 PhnA domain-containing protein [Motilimonas cestriensis]